MSELKAVLFDVDGVIIDSKEANAEFYAVLLEKAAYKRPTRKTIDRYFHLPMWQAIERLTGSKDEAEIRRIWDLGHEADLYPAHLLKYPSSLTSILTELSRHYRLAIVTSRVRQGLDTMYRATGTEGLFDVAVTFEDYSHPKPDPEPLQVAIRRMKVNPSEAVYVGDSHVDVEAARAAGLWSIHLSPRKHDDATMGVTDFDELLTAIAEIAQRIRSNSSGPR